VTLSVTGPHLHFSADAKPQMKICSTEALGGIIYKSSAIAEKDDHCVCLLLADRQHPYIDMGQKNWGGLLCPFGWVELDGGLLLMFGEYLYHRHYGGDQHFLNLPSSLRRPVSSQVSSKYILNITYLHSYF